jgi:hypothetical protein
MAHVRMPTEPRCPSPTNPSWRPQESRAASKRSQPYARSTRLAEAVELARPVRGHRPPTARLRLHDSVMPARTRPTSVGIAALRALLGGGPAVLGLLSPSPGKVTTVGREGLAGGHVPGHIGQPTG